MPGPKQPVDYSGLGEGLATGLTHVLKAGDYYREMGATLDEWWDVSGEKTLEDLRADRERIIGDMDKPVLVRGGAAQPGVKERRNEVLQQQIDLLDTTIRQRTEGVTLPELRDSMYEAEVSAPTFWEQERSFHEERIESYYPAWAGLDPEEREKRYDDLREKYAPLRMTNPIVGAMDNIFFGGQGSLGNVLDVPSSAYAGGAGAAAQWLETAGGIMQFLRKDIPDMAPDELPDPVRNLIYQVAKETAVTPREVMDNFEHYIGAAASEQRALQAQFSKPGLIPRLTESLMEASGFIVSVKAAAGLKLGAASFPAVAAAHGRSQGRQSAVIEGAMATAMLPFFPLLTGKTDSVRFAKGTMFGYGLSLAEEGLAKLEDFMKLGLGDPAMATEMMKPESRWFQHMTQDDAFFNSWVWGMFGKLPHNDPIRARFMPEQQAKWEGLQKKNLDLEQTLERLDDPSISRGARGRGVATAERQMGEIAEQSKQLGIPFPRETSEAFIQRLRDANGVVRRAATDQVGLREAFRRELHEAVERGEVVKLEPMFLDEAIMPLMDSLAYRYGRNHPELPTDAGYATLGFRYSENPGEPSPGAQEARRVSEQRVARTRRTRAKKKAAGAKQRPAAKKERAPDFELRPDPAEKRHDWFVTATGEHPAGEANAKAYLGRTPGQGGPAPVDLAVSTSSRAEQDAMDRQRDGAWKPVTAGGQTTRRAVPARGKPQPYYPDYREGALRPLTLGELGAMIEPLKGGGFRVKKRGHVITPEGVVMLELPDGKHAIAGGPAGFEHRTQIVADHMTPKDVLHASTWYERSRQDLVDRYGEDLGAQLHRVWLVLQVSASPESAWTQTLNLARQVVLGGPKAGLGLGAEAALEIMETGQMGPATSGVGKKIWSFLDSGEGKERSTIYGNDERIGGPHVADVWDARMRGFTDPTMLRGRGEGLHKIFEKAGDDVTLRLLDAIPADLSMKSKPTKHGAERVKSGVLDDVQYDYSHRKGNADVEIANRIGWMGKSNWRTPELQAVFWAAGRRSHGYKDADPTEIFKNSTAGLEKALQSKWKKRNSTPAERVRDTSDTMSFVSPNVHEDVPWRKAVAGLGDPYHRLAADAYKESHNAVYAKAKVKPGIRTHPNVLGYWESTGEVAVVKEHLAGTEWKNLRVEAALDGFAGRQKAVAIFERGVEPKAGTDQMAARAWEISMPKGLSADRVIGALDRRGFKGYSVEMEPNKETARRVWLVDPGNENAPRVQSLMKEIGARGNWMDGRVEFLGKETRAEAGKYFEGIIRGSGRKDLLERVVLPVNDGRRRKGTDLGRLAGEADALLKASTQQVAPIQPFVAARPLSMKEVRAFEAEIGFKVNAPKDIPVIPALARGRRGSWKVEAFGENEYVTHPALSRIAGYASLPKSGLTRGYIDKANGEFIDTAQAKAKYGKSESTDFWMKPEKVSGVARFRQTVPDARRDLEAMGMEVAEDLRVIGPAERAEYTRKHGPPSAIAADPGDPISVFGRRSGSAFIDEATGKVVAYIPPERPPLQRVEGELRGETEIPIGQPVSPEVQALMRFTRTADPVTAVHEMSHYAIEAMMTPAERRRLYGSLGAKDVDKIPDLLRERAAKQAEKYFRDGRAPSPELQPMFDRLAEAMRTWWVHSRDYWSGVGELTPEVRRSLDLLLLPDSHSVAEARELSNATGYDAAHRHRKDMPGTMADAARAYQAAQEPVDPAGMVWRKNPKTGQRERVKWTDNINLDKIKGPEDWRAIMLAVGQATGPESRKRTEKLTWGEARVRADNIGLTPEEIKLGVSQERGAWVWDHTTMDRAADIAVMLQGNMATQARRMKQSVRDGTVTDQDKADMIEAAYQWRTFQDTLSAQVSEVARTLNIMRRVRSVTIGAEGDLPLKQGAGESKRNAQLRIDQIKAFEKQRKYSDVTGDFDWLKFAEALDQPTGAGLAKTMNEVSRPSVTRALEEIWTANLLTGFRTQARNIGSNIAFNLWRIPEMQVAGLIGEGRYLAGKMAGIKAEDRVKITDALAYTYGAVRSGEAIITGMGRLLAEEPLVNRLADMGVFGRSHTPETLARAREAGGLPEGVEELLFEQKVKPEYRSAFGAQAFGLEGTGVGKAMDVYGETARAASFTMLQLGDVPFKIIGYNEAMSRLAFHRAAKDLGGQHKLFSTPAFWERVQYHQDHPTPKMVEAAQENARYQTFTSQTMGPIAKALALGARNIPIAGKMMLPFVQIGSNLFGAGFERSPLAPVLTPKRFGSTIYGTPEGGTKRQFLPKGGAKFDEQMAKWMMGTAVSTFFAYQAAQGNFTGAGPPDYVDNLAWRQKYQPYSFKWTNPMTGKREWVSYRDLDPLAYILGMGADFGASEEGKQVLQALSDHIGLISDFAELAPYADPDATGEAAAKIVESVAALATSRTYWMTAARWTEAISGRKEYQVRGALSTVVRSLTPRFAQQFRYNEDPYRRETRTADVNPLVRAARTALNDLRNTVASKSRDLPPKRTTWGDRDRVGGVVGPDLVSFIYSQERQADPVIREQVRLGLSFAPVKWKVEAVRLGPWQRDHWARTAGKAAKARMDLLVTDQASINPRDYWSGARPLPMKWSQMSDDERRGVMKGVVNEERRKAFDPILMTVQGIKVREPGKGLLPFMSGDKRRQIERRRARP